MNAGEAENLENRVGVNLNFLIMKKLRFVLGSAAFLVAVGGAFAGKNIKHSSNLQQFYEEVDSECRPTECSPLNTTNLCDINSIYVDPECNELFMQPTWRQP